MEIQYIFYIYIYGVVILAFALMEEFSVNDIVASVLFGLTWPITVPAKILRKLIR